MPSLLLTIFILQLTIHLINTVGATAIDELLWTLYNTLPTRTRSAVQDSKTLRAEVVRLRKEMTATSSQDEFAKWAKLRRGHDKAVAKYDDNANALKTHRQTFTRITTTLRYLGTNGLRLLLQFYFAKTPLFWIPTGWVPNYAAFLLAFPRAPRGSVSVQVWGIACATVVQMVFAAGAAAWVLLMRGREEGVGMGKQGRRKEEEGVAMGGGGEGKKEI
ncbi:GET complex subunit get1 [Xanthoria parietina]